jgi:hypothetical protein
VKKNWRKVTLYTAGVVAVIGVAGAVALHALVDPERIKQEARKKALAAWGLDLSIGELSLEILPFPTLRGETIALVNPPGSKVRSLFRAGSVMAELELTPLLWGQFLVKRASVQDGYVRYQRSDGALETWHIDEATVESMPGLRDVRAQGRMSREQRPVQVKAQFTSLAHLGVPGAVSQGTIELDWGKTQLALEGKLPLEATLQRSAFTTELKSTSLQDMLAFLGVERRATAAISAHVEVKESKGRLELSKIKASLGNFNMSGDAQVSMSGPKRVINARLEGDRLDWPRAMLDAGEPPVPPLETDEMFYDRPLAWPVLVGLQGSEGKADVKLKDVVLRNGVELHNLRMQAAFDGDRLDVASFATDLLGGSATGNVKLDGRRKQVKLEFDGANLLLERWFRERRRNIPFTGGPMQVKATIAASGPSMRHLAATMTGPVTIRMGPGVYASKKAGDAEALMTAFSKKDSSQQIDLECAGASLAFVNGRATGERIVGARSAASQLLTSGTVDMREESVDLRGRLRPKPGAGVGLSAIAGDIQINGKIREMKVHLDPAGAPGAIARGAAAIATAGLSLLLSGSSSGPDPCEAVFVRR